MRKVIILLCLLFVFAPLENSFLTGCNAFAQEDIPFDFPTGLTDTLQPPTPPGQPEIPVPKKKSVIKEPEAVSEVRTEESRVFLDFREADIREVARILSKISGVSILVSEDVSAKVTLNIEGVTWKKALELILRTYNLAMIEKEDFIIVVTYKKIQEEQEQVPLSTDIITLNFVDIEEAKTYLQSVMSKRGSIEGDKRTNSLIITDTPEAIEKAKRIVKDLDIRTPQVLIEVLMVDKKVEDEFKLGIDWSLTDEETEGTSLERSVSQSLPLTDEIITFNYGTTMFEHTRLEATIEALASNADVDIIANPKILTLDNESANIKIVEQIPYTSESTSTDGGTTTSTQFKDAGVVLDVKPHITPDGHIVLDVETEQSFQVDSTEDGEPVINSRNSKSTMMILDGQTVVIGGLRKKDDITTVTKVPFLGDIPWIGAIFRREVSDYTTREFLIFITPTIVKEPMEVASNKENKKILEENISHDKNIRKTARSMLGYEDHSEEDEKEEDMEIKETDASEQDETAEIISQFYKMAISSYRNNEYQKAKELFGKVQEINSEYKNVSRYLELVSMAIKRQEEEKKAREEKERREKEAKAVQERAQKEREKQAEANRVASELYSKALSLYRQKEYMAAKDLFIEIKNIKPDYRGVESYLEKIPKAIELKKEREKAQEEKERREKEVRVRQQKEREKLQVASELYQKALSLYRKEDYANAKDMFAEVQKVKADYRSTSRYLEIIPQRIESLRKEKQVQELRKKEREKTQAASKLYKKALWLYRDKKYKEAKNMFLEVQKVKPDYGHTNHYIKTIPEMVERQKEAQRRQEASWKKERDKKILPDFGNLDILPLKGPNE